MSYSYYSLRSALYSNPQCSLVVRCCNTCDDLIKMYQHKQWSIVDILRNSTQCVRDRASHFASVGSDEGCMVSGVMKVNKVAGNFHIAHGESMVRDGRHIHQFNPVTAPSFNISHTIHSISFGNPYPSMPANPLDKGTHNPFASHSATEVSQCSA